MKQAMTKNHPYKEGDWFAVPLLDKGYSIGLIARRGTKGGILLGYLFGPLREALPSAQDTLPLHPALAILVCQFCDPGLVRGEWPIIFRPEQWRREEWPQPAFSHIDLVDNNKAYRREYPVDNPSELFIRELPISLEEAHLLPEDGLYGHTALQRKLTRMLFSHE